MIKNCNFRWPLSYRTFDRIQNKSKLCFLSRKISVEKVSLLIKMCCVFGRVPTLVNHRKNEKLVALDCALFLVHIRVLTRSFYNYYCSWRTNNILYTVVITRQNGRYKLSSSTIRLYDNTAERRKSRFYEKNKNVPSVHAPISPTAAKPNKWLI